MYRTVFIQLCQDKYSFTFDGIFNSDFSFLCCEKMPGVILQEIKHLRIKPGRQLFHAICLLFSYSAQNDDCALKHSRITALYVSLVTKGRLESPKCNFFGSV